MKSVGGDGAVHLSYETCRVWMSSEHGQISVERPTGNWSSTDKDDGATHPNRESKSSGAQSQNPQRPHPAGDVLCHLLECDVPAVPG